VLVYDTSGPYTDPAVSIDIRQGLAECARGNGLPSAATPNSLAGLTSRFGLLA
jgi:phosphomethylpyrimidine synthase